MISTRFSAYNNAIHRFFTLPHSQEITVGVKTEARYTSIAYRVNATRDSQRYQAICSKKPYMQYPLKRLYPLKRVMCP